MEDFKRIFIYECIEHFAMDSACATASYEALESQVDESCILAMCNTIGAKGTRDLDASKLKIFTVLIPTIAKQTHLSALEYHFLLGGLFRRHLQNLETSDAQLLINNVPMHRELFRFCRIDCC